MTFPSYGVRQIYHLFDMPKHKSGDMLGKSERLYIGLVHHRLPLLFIISISVPQRVIKKKQIRYCFLNSRSFNPKLVFKVTQRDHIVEHNMSDSPEQCSGEQTYCCEQCPVFQDIISSTMCRIVYLHIFGSH